MMTSELSLYRLESEHDPLYRLIEAEGREHDPVPADRRFTDSVPVSVYTKIREEHDAQTTKFQQTYAYSGGMGQVVLEKVQAEPGQAPERDGNGELVFNQGDLVFSDTSPERHRDRSARHRGP